MTKTKGEIRTVQAVKLPIGQTLERGRVYSVSYDCTVRGLEEDGTILAYWTGEVDMWGKLTFEPVRGAQPHYLFPDEITDLEPA